MYCRGKEKSYDVKKKKTNMIKANNMLCYIYGDKSRQYQFLQDELPYFLKAIYNSRATHLCETHRRKIKFPDVLYGSNARVCIKQKNKSQVCHKNRVFFF